MQTPATPYLFVYGSLRKGFHHPAYEYISRYFRFAGDARVKGKLYDLGSYPAALPTEEDSFITGELYCINTPDEFDWAIAQLDDYEGLNTENGEPSLYRRDTVTVYLNDATETAWIYWYNRPVNEQTRIPTGDLLAYLRGIK
ncbi:gamma-glutamylcyclotransferase family protein [Sediminibacterium soli]|uniref:gamma-glutamylcyclotransferase family protein n=1 Tax=Sediminibacterium soli TaxID=2698829 RepID=UPI0013794231|nr:gamma-glutamylcyclotransferase family protein [Sediminibacterium soli]NCI47809.1 gamma-glutamylcyclotransferase [Sediminibacterium soli]